MRRREFIAGVAGVVADRPLVARAQQSSELPRIGSIHTTRGENSEAFFQGLREAGYVDGQNVLLELRFSEGELGPIDAFARELVALKCRVIFASNPYAIRAVMKATTTIPIIGVDLEDDPVANGWVKNIARPGGGVFLDLPELGG